MTKRKLRKSTKISLFLMAYFTLIPAGYFFYVNCSYHVLFTTIVMKTVNNDISIFNIAAVIYAIGYFVMYNWLLETSVYE